MEVQIILVLVTLVAITALYKFLPFRELDERKPAFAPMPKYKSNVSGNISDEKIESTLTSLGFKKVKEKGSLSKYSRGSVLGDISIKLAKVNIYVNSESSSKRVVSIQAGWVAAFDTGNHWQLLKELCDKLENA